jgi:hypothetical protein
VHDIEPDEFENVPAVHAVHATPEKPALQAVGNAVDDTVCDASLVSVAKFDAETDVLVVPETFSLRLSSGLFDVVADDLDVALANAVDDTVADDFDVAVEKIVAELMDETDIEVVALKLSKELPVITLLTVAD